MSPPGRK